MRIMITNDDGIRAEGLAILEEIALSITDDVWVVAPEVEQSGAAHSLTIHLPIRVIPLGPKRFAVRGTPTDCVMVGTRALLDKMPDLILSGINHGTNLGDDITYSGTVAAAMEAALLDLPAIALSQAVNYGQKANWDYARTHGAHIIKQAFQAGIPNNTLLNINFPNPDETACTGIEIVEQGNKKISDNVQVVYDPMGAPIYWIGRKQHAGEFDPKSDYAAIERGKIAVTPLHLNMTDYAGMQLYKDMKIVVK